jgi:hypothetical protein
MNNYYLELNKKVQAAGALFTTEINRAAYFMNKLKRAVHLQKVRQKRINRKKGIK